MSAEHAAVLLAEMTRRRRLRIAVARAGFRQADSSWVRRSALTDAVAAVLGHHRGSHALAVELRQFLLTEGWRERRYCGIWEWRAERAVAEIPKPKRR